MSSVPGQRSGPIPKRSDQRRRRNAPDPGLGEITKALGARVVPVPPAYEDWDEIALDFYESLPRSGQSQFYQPSDWALAVVISESLSRDLKPQALLDQDGRAVLDANDRPIMRRLPLKGANLSAYLKAMQSLLVTEGDRRRLRLELQSPGAEPDQPDRPANVVDLRDRLAAG